MFVSRGRGLWVSMALASLVLAGCGTRMTRAPVEDRGTAVGAPSGEVVAPAAKPLPGAENAGKPGYYTVKPGDTLIRIGLDTGQSWKDLARWNNMDNPNLIEVGQVLRVAPPVVAAAAPVAIGPADYTAFEALLKGVNEAWSREDLAALSRMATLTPAVARAMMLMTTRNSRRVKPP